MADPHFPPETAALRDGTVVSLRFLQPDDVERIKAFFYRLSPESVFYRLLEYRTTISEAEARELCAVDGVRRVAIAALLETDAGPAIVGVGRYGLVEANQPETAEAAVVVRDDYQGRGLGRVLMTRVVAYARAHGVKRFVATIHVNNAKILNFINHSGLPVENKVQRGVWDVVVKLTAPPE